MIYGFPINKHFLQSEGKEHRKYMTNISPQMENTPSSLLRKLKLELHMQRKTPENGECLESSFLLVNRHVLREPQWQYLHSKVGHWWLYQVVRCRTGGDILRPVFVTKRERTQVNQSGIRKQRASWQTVAYVHAFDRSSRRSSSTSMICSNVGVNQRESLVCLV